MAHLSEQPSNYPCPCDKEHRAWADACSPVAGRFSRPCLVHMAGQEFRISHSFGDCYHRCSRRAGFRGNHQLGCSDTVAGCRTTRRMSRRSSPEPFAALQPTSRNAAFEVVHAPSNIESHAEKGHRVTDKVGAVAVLSISIWLEPPRLDRQSLNLTRPSGES
jgi:hypothetical protein